MSDENPQDPPPPRPPRAPIPPLPPRTGAPAPLSTDPLVAFLQRRLESLEQDLNDERERAQAAQNLMQQQQALRGEVDEQLKALSEQLRREKNEKENLETRSHDQGRIDALEKRLDEMHQTWAAILKDSLGPKSSQAKDEALARLEQENRELAKALGERSEALRRYVMERRQVEESMGQSLMTLHGELSAEREKTRAAPRRISDLEHEAASLKDRLEDAQAALARQQEREATLLAERDQRIALLVSERDALSKSLLAEAGKLRSQLDERRTSEEKLTQRINEEMINRLAVAELRGQIATLSEHMARALQEKDAALKLSESWRTEREQLLAALQKKEEMLAMLSTTFQGMLQK